MRLRPRREDGVGVGRGLLGVQHGRDPPKITGTAPAAVGIGDLPAAPDLAGEHHGDGHRVGAVIEVELLHVLVDEGHRDLRRQRGGHDHRAMGWQVELGLAHELRPAG